MTMRFDMRAACGQVYPKGKKNGHLRKEVAEGIGPMTVVQVKRFP